MTAEIAILNRVGVALAADSAVTISSAGGDQKTYNSADKLFALDGHHPVAIMIHGSAEFMGIPAETIIKRYKSSKFNQPQQTLAGYARQFADFMRHDLPIEHKTIIRRLSTVVVDLLAHVRAEAEEDYGKASQKRGRSHQRPGVFMARRMTELVQRHTARLNDIDKMENLGENALPQELSAIVEQAISTVMGDGMLDRLPLILDLVRSALLRQVSLGGEIGFVFAGFGTDQIFPGVESFECDLALVGDIRLRAGVSETISADQVAIITPFAQSEMVQRFMDGVDNGYIDFAREMIRTALSNFGNEIADRLGAEDRSDAKELAKDLQILRDGYVDELERAAYSFRTAHYRRKILEVVQFMPKAELAEMAESLVNLTSIKRRVSAEHETVGGPIDVAFVSRYDGFAWVRRKGDAGVVSKA